MPATTANKFCVQPDDLGQIVSQHIVDGKLFSKHAIDRISHFQISDFVIRRLGTKDYAFFYLPDYSGFVARYYCSYIEAKRRFSLYLIVRRLTV